MDAKGRWEQERQEGKVQREESIIDAAKQVFARKGFDKSTMQDVAKEIPVGVATVFRYFPKKEKLIIAVACSVISSQTTAFRSIVAGSGTCLDKLGNLFDLFISFQHEEHRVNIQLVEAFESFAALSAEPLDGIDDYLLAYRESMDTFRGLIEQGMRDGSLRQDIPVEETLHTIISTFGNVSKKLFLLQNLPRFQSEHETKKQLLMLKELFLDYLKA
ncbi:helix-turn-helix domain-containing protein [Paenibacillus sp. LHD-117]|uniref:TetR/AcrR family transcriptional regulator n=1 Tax=Paenibacillus sp. LHD-117 TaxID=3071412 RepID=UPI0027DF32AD|nr:helix-turn-helix domain-containing protein [Paenibacillus sp. LHD-117]MDQ6420646.1 helix-turn-helix domain-containing protein [Paenibacillus sp. LHD-117]